MHDRSLPSPLPVALNASKDSRESAVNAALENEVVSLFDQFRTSLFRYMLTLGVAAADAEELIQEVFLALFRHLRGGKSRHNLRGWIFRVAHNLALKRRSSLRREGSAPLNENREAAAKLVDPGLSPEDSFALHHAHSRLLATVHALPEYDQRCLSLRAEGLRYREIAEVLGISLGTVAKSLERSLTRLARVADR